MRSTWAAACRRPSARRQCSRPPARRSHGTTGHRRSGTPNCFWSCGRSDISAATCSPTCGGSSRSAECCVAAALALLTSRLLKRREHRARAGCRQRTPLRRTASHRRDVATRPAPPAPRTPRRGRGGRAVLAGRFGEPDRRRLLRPVRRRRPTLGPGDRRRVRQGHRGCRAHRARPATPCEPPLAIRLRRRRSCRPCTTPCATISRRRSARRALRSSRPLGHDTYRIELSLGGHPQPLLRRRDGQVEPVGALGMLLGMIEPTLSTTVVDVMPGDTLVFYTDGLTDAPAERGGLGRGTCRAPRGRG